MAQSGKPQLHPLHLPFPNPDIRARFESRGGRPLVQVTHELLRAALSLLRHSLQPSNRAERLSPWDGGAGLHGMFWWGDMVELWLG